ncbi:hypothetical protein [Trueperella pecoris]|uniref:hypothetical protein n=1 Tax=Trueperella pecoris TaxID=2733571 RepID=UPI00186B6240|nr:hypothetical protein [Trueperella pecoris]QOQ39547.1 hypothetical protein HLG82_08915 [Trueperella pecoris]
MKYPYYSLLLTSELPKEFPMENLLFSSALCFAIVTGALSNSLGTQASIEILSDNEPQIVDLEQNGEEFTFKLTIPLDSIHENAASNSSRLAE